MGYEDMLTGQDCQADNINTVHKAFMEYFFQSDNVNTVHKAFMEYFFLYILCFVSFKDT